MDHEHTKNVFKSYKTENNHKDNKVLTYNIIEFTRLELKTFD